MKLEIFEKLLPKRQAEVEVKEKEETKTVTRLSWFSKQIIKGRIFWSELNPFNTVFMLIIGSFLFIFIFGFMIPGVEIPSKIPILGGILVAGISWSLANHFNRNVRNRICELSFESTSVFVDNRKLNIYDGGEVLFLVDSSGKPIINQEEENLVRYNHQKTLFIPKNVINQFGSILGRRAKAYPDTKLQDVNTQSVDLSIIYIPKKVSESRLLKKLENVEENNKVASEIIDQLRENVMNIIKNLRGHETEQLKSLITSMSMLQETFMSTPTKLQGLLQEQYFKASGYGRYGSRYPYRSFGYGGSRFGGYGSPNWDEITRSSSDVPTELRKKDEDEE